MTRFKQLGRPAVGSIRIGDEPNLVDGEVIVIGTQTFEADDDAGVTAGNIAFEIVSGSAEDTVANLIVAINANNLVGDALRVNARVDSLDVNTVRLVNTRRGEIGNSVELSTTMADPDNVVSAVDDAMFGGANAGNVGASRGEYTVTAVDVSAGSIEIETGLRKAGGVGSFQLQVRTSTGVQKYVTSKVTTEENTAYGHRIKIDFDGATNPAATDVVHWFAMENGAD